MTCTATIVGHIRDPQTGKVSTVTLKVTNEDERFAAVLAIEALANDPAGAYSYKSIITIEWNEGYHG